MKRLRSHNILATERFNKLKTVNKEKRKRLFRVFTEYFVMSRTVTQSHLDDAIVSENTSPQTFVPQNASGQQLVFQPVGGEAVEDVPGPSQALQGLPSGVIGAGSVQHQRGQYNFPPPLPATILSAGQTFEHEMVSGQRDHVIPVRLGHSPAAIDGTESRGHAPDFSDLMFDDRGQLGHVPYAGAVGDQGTEPGRGNVLGPIGQGSGAAPVTVEPVQPLQLSVGAEPGTAFLGRSQAGLARPLLGQGEGRRSPGLQLQNRVWQKEKINHNYDQSDNLGLLLHTSGAVNETFLTATDQSLNPFPDSDDENEFRTLSVVSEPQTDSQGFHILDREKLSRILGKYWNKMHNFELNLRMLGSEQESFTRLIKSWTEFKLKPVRTSDRMNESDKMHVNESLKKIDKLMNKLCEVSPLVRCLYTLNKHVRNNHMHLNKMSPLEIRAVMTNVQLAFVNSLAHVYRLQDTLHVTGDKDLAMQIASKSQNLEKLIKIAVSNAVDWCYGNAVALPTGPDGKKVTIRQEYVTWWQFVQDQAKDVANRLSNKHLANLATVPDIESVSQLLYSNVMQVCNEKIKTKTNPVRSYSDSEINGEQIYRNHIQGRKENSLPP
ncbi:hypothetical protein, partial [Litorimonas sp.]|uniref:hypothetical protein n=1 Tax=Litorimonas sp. TaxID=1892381 RepID=UPI003A8BCC86